uniref:Uncharacterized protein n=1 Tax=Rhizophora mucronata TaxID=61149 RepID=A0A2P2NS81_RHIMU
MTEDPQCHGFIFDLSIIQLIRNYLRCLAVEQLDFLFEQTGFKFN